MLWFMGSQRVGHSRETELNWLNLKGLGFLSLSRHIGELTLPHASRSPAPGPPVGSCRSARRLRGRTSWDSRSPAADQSSAFMCGWGSRNSSKWTRKIMPIWPISTIRVASGNGWIRGLLRMLGAERQGAGWGGRVQEGCCKLWPRHKPRVPPHTAGGTVQWGFGAPTGHFAVFSENSTMCAWRALCVSRCLQPPLAAFQSLLLKAFQVSAGLCGALFPPDARSVFQNQCTVMLFSC